MTNGYSPDPRPKSEIEIATALRLRPERPAVTRLSRRVVIGIGVIASLAICSALIIGLEARNGKDRSSELYNTDQKTTADGLAKLPRDYSGLSRTVPALGPPLPGDLGRVALAQGQGTTVDPALQRMAQEREAARTAKLFAPNQTQTRSASDLASQRRDPATLTKPGKDLTADGMNPDGLREDKTGFTNPAIDPRTTSLEHLQKPVGPDVVEAGTVIPAALVTGIRSDLPGTVIGQVTQNIYDSQTGNTLLIPQGAELIGSYDNEVAAGQSRVLLSWSRLILPNGRSLVLEQQPAADQSGYAGLQDRVDEHWGSIFKAAVLSTMLDIGSETGSSSQESDITRALRRGSQDTVNQAGQQIVRRALNSPPTLTIRPGFPLEVIVTRDLRLAPYGSQP